MSSALVRTANNVHWTRAGSKYGTERLKNQLISNFQNVFRVRTTSVFIQENNVHIDDKVFTDMNEASTILLDKIHWLLLED